MLKHYRAEGIIVSVITEQNNVGTASFPSSGYSTDRENAYKRANEEALSKDVQFEE